MTPNSIVHEIQDHIESFEDGIYPVQKELYNKVSLLIKELSIELDGTIKTTSSNMKIFSKIQSTLENVVNNPDYQDNVINIKDSLKDVISLQTDYFDNITDLGTEPVVLKHVINQSFEDSVNSLTETGINTNVVSKASEIVSTGIIEGHNIVDMSDKLKTYMLGDKDIDGSLVRYSKGIISDTLHSASRTYNSLMVDKLDMKWYTYVGALKETSRELCQELVDKRWIHESELGGISHGVIDNKQYSTAGMMPGTNKDNFVNRCGGYNCNHHLINVPDEMVPKKVRNRFERKNNPSMDEIVAGRPKH